MSVMPGDVLVGRRLARGALRSAIDAAFAGLGGVVLLTGDAGMGKTALVTDMTAFARVRGAALAWGACWEGDGAPAFWPWIQVFRALPRSDGDAIDAVLKELTGAEEATAGLLDDSTLRFRTFDAVASCLRRVAARQPTVLVLEDLHWSDASSLRLLSFVVQHVADVALLVVGTCRTGDGSSAGDAQGDLLGQLATRSELLQLGGLTVDEVGELVHKVAGERPPATAAELVHARTGGNPFFVQQLARLLAAESGPWDRRPALTTVPPGVADVLSRRLARLPAELREMLAVAAVVGPSFPVGFVADLSGVGLAAAAELVDQASRLGVLVRAEAGTSRFAHDLFREVLYAGLAGGRRAELHLALAERLEQAVDTGFTSAAAIAHHRSSALPLGDRDRAAAALVSAGQEAADRRAYDESERYLARAVEVAGGLTVADLDMVGAYADALRRAGHGNGARAAYVAAAARARAAGDVQRLAHVAFGAHRVPTMTDVSRADVIALLDEALADDRVEPGDRWLLSAALARELADGPDHDRDRAAALGTAAVDGAQRVGDARALGYALFALIDVRWQPGAARERLALADRLVAVATEAGETELALEGRLARVVALLELGDPRYGAAVDELSRVAEDSGIPHYAYLARSRAATRACVTGPLPVADELVEAAGAYGARIEEPDAWGVQASQLVGLALMRRDWTRITALAQTRGLALVPPEFAFEQQAWLAIEQGDGGGAAAAVAALPERTPLTYRWRSAARLAMDAELVVAVGDRARAAVLYDALLPIQDEFAVVAAAVFTTGPVALQLGLLATVVERWDVAIRHLRDAVTRCDRVGARPHGVRARDALARALMVRGSADDQAVAARLRAEAAAVAAQVGLAPPVLGDVAGAESVTSFMQDGDTWTLSYAGRRVVVRDAKGLHDLAVLLAAPGREVAATDLLAGAEGGPPRPALGSDAVLDERARAAYRRRLAGLEAELEEADARGDRDRSARVIAEREALLDELRRATGLGGRHRRLGDEAERARTTVTARIRSSIRRIEQVHPELGRHLAGSVLTGAVCSYRPADTMTWATRLTP
jgi:AAA ATPase domain